MSGTPSKPETILQAQIVAALEAAGFIAIRVHSGAVKVRRGYMQLAPKGWPDMYVLGCGWLETKTATGKLRVEQRAVHERIAREGEFVAVASVPSEAVACCAMWRKERAR